MVLLLGIPSTLSVGAQPASPPAAGPALGVAELAVMACDELDLLGVPIVRHELGEVECGTLQVPENWLQPEGRTIAITYVVLKATGSAPEPDPIVYLEGGPGGSALSGIDTWAGIFAPHRETRDIVLFDQRGTQFSSKLDCSTAGFESFLEDLDDGDEEAEDEEEAEAGEPIELTPDWDIEEMMTIARQETGDEVAACVRDLLQQGIDLRQYNSVASARDTVALMGALGYETYNLYGISYGTRLALVIMRDFPNSGLRSVVLDSTFPPEIKGFELFPSEAHEVLMQLFAGCSLDPTCNAAYPDLKQRFKALLRTLQAEPVTDAEGYEIDAVDVIAVARAIPFNVEIAPLFPRLIDELERGETDTYAYIVTSALGDDEGLADDDAGITADDDEPMSDDGDQIPAAEAAASPAAREDAGESASVVFIDAIVELTMSAPEPLRSQIPFLLTALSEMPPTRENLQGFVVVAFDQPVYHEVRDLLLQLVDSMTDEEVEQVFQTIADNLDDLRLLTEDIASAHFNSVECNEEVPFESFANTVANTEALEIPEIAYDVPAFIAQIFAVCEQWPSGRALDIESMSVTSDVPTLILAGAYDFQTPVSWNKQAFVNLPNAYYSEFPMAGHGVIFFSDCAVDVTLAFVDNPTAEPDNSCKAELAPQWVLPDGPLADPDAA
jgi:pimeloyl-ACP methyl ester carboxylesterase